MKTISKYTHKVLLAAAAFALAAGVQSCSLVYDDTDCVESYNLVRFVYDHNMKYTCAFDNEVDAVSVLLFDSETGILTHRFEVPHADLNDYNEMVLRTEPGEYEMLVWGGLHSESFDIPLGKVGESTLDEFHCRMKRLEEEANGDGHVRDDLSRLYHSLIHVSLPYAPPSNPNRVTVPLKKNTNTFRIVLQQLSGGTVDAENFDFTITDQNGWLNHDNSLRDRATICYHPWFTQSGSVDINTNPEEAPTNRPGAPGVTAAETRAGALGATLVEFTTGRLLTSNNPVLTITNTATGKQVLSIPVNDYALLVKGYYHTNISDQEYLDRQDEYNMTFFVNNGKWESSTIIINNWRIVRNVVDAQ